MGGVFFFLWRRRRQQRGGDDGEPGVQRHVSTMSKSGLLRTEKDPKYPSPIATSFDKRQSRALDQDSISPVSGSDRRNSTFRIDQRLNPSSLFVFDNGSRGSVGSLDETRDYHRTLNVRTLVHLMLFPKALICLGTQSRCELSFRSLLCRFSRSFNLLLHLFQSLAAYDITTYLRLHTRTSSNGVILSLSIHFSIGVWRSYDSGPS